MVSSSDDIRKLRRVSFAPKSSIALPHAWLSITHLLCRILRNIRLMFNSPSLFSQPSGHSGQSETQTQCQIILVTRNYWNEERNKDDYIWHEFCPKQNDWINIIRREPQRQREVAFLNDLRNCWTGKLMIWLNRISKETIIVHKIPLGLNDTKHSQNKNRSPSNAIRYLSSVPVLFPIHIYMHRQLTSG